jgi:hypothetical protein
VKIFRAFVDLYGFTEAIAWSDGFGRFQTNFFTHDPQLNTFIAKPS